MLKSKNGRGSKAGAGGIDTLDASICFAAMVFFPRSFPTIHPKGFSLLRRRPTRPPASERSSSQPGRRAGAHCDAMYLGNSLSAASKVRWRAPRTASWSSSFEAVLPRSAGLKTKNSYPSPTSSAKSSTICHWRFVKGVPASRPAGALAGRRRYSQSRAATAKFSNRFFQALCPPPPARRTSG